MIVKSCNTYPQQCNTAAGSLNQEKYHIIPATGFVRLDQVLQVIPISKNSWWVGVREGRFPQSIKLGHRTTVWKAEDIHQLILELGEVEA